MRRVYERREGTALDRATLDQYLAEGIDFAIHTIAPPFDRFWDSIKENYGLTNRLAADSCLVLCHRQELEDALKTTPIPVFITPDIRHFARDLAGRITDGAILHASKHDGAVILYTSLRQLFDTELQTTLQENRKPYALALPWKLRPETLPDRADR